MITERTLSMARSAAEELRSRGENDRAKAIEALVEAASGDTVPSLDLLTSTQAGDLLGVSGQTVKNWIREGRLAGYRVGGRIMPPKDAVADYIRRARTSLELEVIADDVAAQLVAEGRHRPA